MRITTLNFMWFTLYCTTLFLSQTTWKFGNEMRRIMKRIIFTNRVKNEKVLRRDKGKRNILHTIKRRRDGLIGNGIRRNSLPKHVTEGKIQVRKRRGRRRKQLLDDEKEKRRYWKLKEEALDRFYEELALEEAVSIS